MYVTDDFVYIQLQKTGCSHIAAILSKLYEGKQIGKHNPATWDQIKSARYFISSIRNPWDWYLSLWAYGIEGKGGLRDQLTKRDVYRAVKTTARNPRRGFPAIGFELMKDVNRWRAVYSDVDNVNAFRRWLSDMHDPHRRHDLGEGYGETAIAGFSGFMTYRYLSLCCTDAAVLCDSGAINTYSALAEFEETHCYISDFVRQECLEDSLCSVLETIRPLTQEQRDLIYGAAKTNVTNRRLLASDYYDDASIELVNSRERLLIEKFDYRPPGLTENSRQGAWR